jgi:hypothetical protein
MIRPPTVSPMTERELLTREPIADDAALGRLGVPSSPLLVVRSV